MPYLINGSTASLTPYMQEWIDRPYGPNARGFMRYSNLRDVRLTFDSCTAALYKQWEDTVNGGSVGTMTLLQPDTIAFTAYSTVVLEWEKKPTLRTGMAAGDWSILVKHIEV